MTRWRPLTPTATRNGNMTCWRTWCAADWICHLSTECCAGKYNETCSDGKAVRSSSRVLRLIDGMTDVPVHLRGYLAASRCPRCWATTPQASRWTPTLTSPPTHSLRRRKRWGASSPVRYRPFRYPLPLGSAFGSGKSSGRKQQLIQTKRPETLRFRVFWHAVRDSNPRPSGP